MYISFFFQILQRTDIFTYTALNFRSLETRGFVAVKKFKQFHHHRIYNGNLMQSAVPMACTYVYFNEVTTSVYARTCRVVRRFRERQETPRAKG